jgi:hypothetical protein
MPVLRPHAASVIPAAAGKSYPARRKKSAEERMHRAASHDSVGVTEAVRTDESHYNASRFAICPDVHGEEVACRLL